jgi:hypothetical protein
MEEKMTIKIANRLIIDFDSMPIATADALATKIEQFINRECPEVALHGTCAALDDETLVWEVEGRQEQRVSALAVERLQNHPSFTMVRGTAYHMPNHNMPRDCESE